MKVTLLSSEGIGRTFSQTSLEDICSHGDGYFRSLKDADFQGCGSNAVEVGVRHWRAMKELSGYCRAVRVAGLHRFAGAI